MLFELKRYPFADYVVDDAPEESGVYLLWEDDELTYVGVTEGETTVRSRLRDHLEGRILSSCAPTHYSWRLSLEPKALATEMLGEYAKRISRNSLGPNFAL